MNVVDRPLLRSLLSLTETLTASRWPVIAFASPSALIVCATVAYPPPSYPSIICFISSSFTNAFFNIFSCGSYSLDSSMTFTQHLGELRHRVIISLIAIAAGAAVAFGVYNNLLSLFIYPPISTYNIAY